MCKILIDALERALIMFHLLYVVWHHVTYLDTLWLFGMQSKGKTKNGFLNQKNVVKWLRR